MSLSKDELWKIYEMLPESLKQAIVSEDTAEAIWNICKICNIKEENVPKIAGEVGNVLMGLLPPKRFKDRIKSVLSLDDDTAKKLDVYISHYVFDPLKDELGQLYETKQEENTQAQEKPLNSNQ